MEPAGYRSPGSLCRVNSRNRTKRSDSSRRRARPASSGDEGLPGLRQVFAEALKSVRGLAAAIDPIDTEMSASWLLAMWDVYLIDVPDPVAFLGTRFVEFLATRRQDEDARAMLLGLAAVGPEAVAVPARRESVRLRAIGPQPPVWADVIGRARFIEAWSAGDEYGDQESIVGVFEHDGYPPHAIVALVDYNLGGILKDALVAPADEIRAEWDDMSELLTVGIDAQAYVDRMDAAITAYDEIHHPQATDDARDLRQLLRARLRELPDPRVTEVREFRQGARSRLLDEFERSAAGQTVGADAALASYFIDFGADGGSGDPLRWSPSVVEICLLDWFPRKVTIDRESAERIPAVLGAWVRFAAEKKGLEPASVEATLATIDEVAAEALEAIVDPARGGLAKTFVSAMLGEGVDVSDPEAVERWIADFNARPVAERDLLLGPHAG